MRSQSYNYKRIRRRRRRRLRAKLLFLLIEVLLFVVLLLFLKSTFVRKDPLEVALKLDETEDYPEWIDVQFIDEGNPSRTGEELDGVNDIVIHYVGNPGTTAQQNRDFYNQAESDVCSHFVVGMDGEIIMCLPLQ